MVLGKSRLNSMKVGTASSRWLRNHATRGRILVKVLKGSVSSLGLIGSLAIFKQLESTLEHSDSEGRAFLGDLIKDVESRIDKMKERSKFLKETAKSKGPNYSDVVWLFVAIPSFCGAFRIGVCILPFVKGYIRYKKEMRDEEKRDESSDYEEVTVEMVPIAT